MELIAAARELFAAEGFASVSIRRITQRANCPPMTFYVYFKSKRALLYHIWTDVFAALMQACAAAAREGTSPKDQVRRYLVAMVDYWLAHPDSYRIVYMTEDFVDADDEPYFTHTMEAGGRLLNLEALLEAGVAQGVLRPLDTIEMTQVLFTAAIGIAHALITIPEGAWRRDALITQTFDLLLRGMERRPEALDA